MNDSIESGGWAESEQAWIHDMNGPEEFGRRHILDTPMLAKVRGRGFADAIDIGCGEGRFCRMMQHGGIATIGIEPTEALIDEARARDPQGDYRIGVAERLDLPDASVDLAVSYLSLIDIPDIAAAIPEMARVLRPGGTLLIANLNSFNTARLVGYEDGRPVDAAGDYLHARWGWVEWRGIRIRNYHRPLETYLKLLLGAGLILRDYAEPVASGGDPATAERHRRAPWFHIMEWRKP